MGPKIRNCPTLGGGAPSVENHGPTLRKMADVILDNSILSIEQTAYAVMRHRQYELEVG